MEPIHLNELLTLAMMLHRDRYLDEGELTEWFAIGDHEIYMEGVRASYKNIPLLWEYVNGRPAVNDNLISDTIERFVANVKKDENIKSDIVKSLPDHYNIYGAIQIIDENESVAYYCSSWWDGISESILKEDDLSIGTNVIHIKCDDLNVRYTAPIMDKYGSVDAIVSNKPSTYTLNYNGVSFGMIAQVRANYKDEEKPLETHVRFEVPNDSTKDPRIVLKFMNVAESEDIVLRVSYWPGINNDGYFNVFDDFPNTNVLIQPNSPNTVTISRNMIVTQNQTQLVEEEDKTETDNKTVPTQQYERKHIDFPNFSPAFLRNGQITFLDDNNEDLNTLFMCIIFEDKNGEVIKPLDSDSKNVSSVEITIGTNHKKLRNSDDAIITSIIRFASSFEVRECEIHIEGEIKQYKLQDGSEHNNLIVKIQSLNQKEIDGILGILTDCKFEQMTEKEISSHIVEVPVKMDTSKKTFVLSLV